MKGPRFYGQVMQLFDRFAALKPAAVTSETAKLSAALSSPKPAAAPARRAVPGGDGADPVALWVETARLLTRGGHWQHSVAVMDGLPPTARAAVARTAVQERWALPPNVLAALRALSATAAVPPAAMRAASAGEERPAATAAALRARSGGDGNGGSGVAAAPSSSPSAAALLSATQQQRISTSEATAASYAALPADDLLALAFTLRRPTGSAAAEDLGRAQQHIVAELRSRGMVLELLQCVANWHRRGLVVDRFYASEPQRQGDGASKGAAPPPLTPPPTTFDAVAAVRAILFPPMQRAVPSHTTPAPAPSAAGAVEEPWQVALAAFPQLFARCVRDGGACDRFVRAAGPEGVWRAVRSLLGHITRAGPAGLHAGRSAVAAGHAARDVEVLWRAVWCIARAAQPQWPRETRASKESVLEAVAAALETTQRLRAGLSEKSVVALRGAVETLCSPLPRHAAQVRFLRLSLFARIAVAVEALTAPPWLPNALVQCLFLCMADTYTPPPAAAAAAQSSSSPPSLLEQFLLAPPAGRVQPALALLAAARDGKWFFVSPTHLQSLLSGLQSISIVRTWREALLCVERFEKEMGIFPNDSTVPTVLLNLCQDSWERGFEVLRYYDTGASGAGGGGRPPRRQRPPPPALVRDLHLLSVKHGAWEATLRLMEQMQRAEREGAAPPVGFLSHLYSIYAAGLGGQADTCLAMFEGLRHAPGRRDGTAPLNEMTVALAALGFLDGGHYDSAVLTAATLLEKYGASPLPDAPPPPAPRGGGGGPRSRRRYLSAGAGAAPTPIAVDALPAFSEGGVHMARAMELLGRLHAWQAATGEPRRGEGRRALVELLNALATTPTGGRAEGPTVDGGGSDGADGRVEAAALPRVLHCALAVECMLGLGHLRAPVRLVFDTLGGPGAYEASAAGEYTFETRQVSYSKPQQGAAAGGGGGDDGGGDGHQQDHNDAADPVANRSARRPLYTPPSHRLARAAWVARGLGELASDDSDTPGAVGDGLSSAATRQIARSVARAGVGPEFLKASLM